MMRSQCPGFTLITVLIAIVILSSIMLAITQLTNNTVQQLHRAHALFQRTPLITHHLWHALRTPPEKEEEKMRLTAPEEHTITTHTQKINKQKSQLAPFADLVSLVFVEGVWQNEKPISLCGFIITPQKQETP
jgi:Tfp pilus assembly protein PilV